MKELILKNNKLFHNYEHQFQITFNTPLNKYWNFVTGFDVIKFDEDLKCPDGISLKDFITEKYNEEASGLIGKLLNIKKIKRARRNI